MINKTIIYKNFSNIYRSTFKKDKKVKRKALSILTEIKKNLDHSFDTLHSLSNNFKFSFKEKELKRFKKFNTIIIIGMGGSVLGSEAICDFLKDKIRKKIIFFNDINIEKFKKIKSNKKSNTLYVIISKSGSTIETISNLLSLRLIKRNSKNIIIICKKNNNPLYFVCKKYNLYHIEHKSYISGRYSVLSDVGIVPAFLMGLNIKDMRKNLLVHFQKNKSFLLNSIIRLNNFYKKKYFNNLILLNYVPHLDKFLYWYQQLLAESLGKKGKGFLPLISNVPKDHHSLLQLYLDGPKNKLFYIFSEEKPRKLKRINTKNIMPYLKHLNKKTLNDVKNAQKIALIRSLKKNKIPFREFKIKDFNTVSLGELFSYFMIETAILGKLSEINPFDQPAVEQVKIDTKNILS